MKVATSEYRIFLSQMDREFIMTLLDPEQVHWNHLEKLLIEPDILTQLLDDPRIHQCVLSRGPALEISPHLYFYLVLRHEFQKVQLHNALIAEYVSWALAEFSLKHPTGKRGGISPDSTILHAVDYVELVRSVGAYQKFLLELWAGNYYLIWSGIFHDHLARRERRYGAPGVRFYQKLGWSSFHCAQKHPLADEFAMKNLLAELLESYQSICRALTQLSDEVFIWN